MKTKERLAWTGVVLVLLFALLFRPTPVKAISETSEKYLQLFHEVLGLVQNGYVEPVDEEKVFIGAIKGLIASLGDPHSTFLDEEEYRQMKEETRGSFGGLGMEVAFADGAIVVVSPIEDTPAMRAGILPQDRIIEIDGKSTANLGYSEGIKLMRGKPGSSVSIKLERKNQKEPIQLTLVRENIQIRYVRSHFFNKEKVGYIRLNQFMGENTQEEFKKQLKALVDKKAEGLVVDLRMNPGGLLPLASALSDLFLPPGLDIVSVKGRGGELADTAKSSNSPDKFTKIPMVVLINEGSASASEIFAGAMQDHARAKILGTTSYGKGSVQFVYSLSYGNAVKLTVQKYYTPSGRSLHGKGIQPDIVVKAIEPTEDDRFYLRKMGEKKLLDQLILKFPDYSEQNFQLFEKALKELGIKLSSDVARILFKNRTQSEKERTTTDLDLDPQLRKAIEILSEKKS
ncbi:peptidase, S41 family [Leptospira broomii serovar Hurstbridge str. 5399]|uniref:Peptidase, S41 family n=1 Tax=Leptospira broomii serovar Hurstbridge str. 5399 TaxID=1049789 RepID=T0FCD4_9LEPT|nr:S41 family peptidase [Leptospira broomii]EQA45521.1 peptidase, S41 family [Leptospira broomii serovar Hurstbridge str. 5399]